MMRLDPRKMMTWCGAVAVGGVLAAAGCATAPPPPAVAETRPLTTAEKTLLASTLPAGFKDPSAAQFRWLPIIIRAGTGRSAIALG